MLSTQEKIDEMHSILVKWERRRKWNTFFVWIYRLIFIGLLLVIIFLPNLFLEKLNGIISPLIQEISDGIFDTQKEKLSTFGNEFTDKVKTLYNGQ